MRGAGNIQDKPHSLTTRWVIDNNSPRASLEFSLTRMILPNLSAGIEFMPESDRYSPVVNWRFIEASGWRPAVTVGTSSAWPSSKVSGNAYILSIGNSIAKGLSAYVAASYAPSGDLWQIPAGLNYRINKDWSSHLMYDGDKLHPIITYSYGDIRTSFILLDSKSPTLAVSFSF